MATSPWTPEVLFSLTSAYAAGATTYELGQQHGCTPDWISVLLKRQGVQLRPRGVAKKMTPKAAEAAVVLYRQGKSFEEIGLALQVSPSLVCLTFKKLNVTVRAAKRRDARIVTEDGALFCTCCTQSKPLTDFSASRRGAGRRRSVCRCCDYFKHLERTFALTRDGFQAMWDSQGGACNICHKPLELHDSSRGVHVDHSHCTGKLRDLLCHNCNKGLGNFMDSPDILRRAATYLEKHASSQVATLG